MQTIFKYPNGYDVKVIRKQDVIACIADNIIDKEVALAVIKQCEIDAANFLKEGRWTGIPYIGNIRISKAEQLRLSPEYKALDNEARETLDKDKYILFRRNLAADIGKQVKQERFYKYAVSKAVSKNAKRFRELCLKYSDAHARFYFFCVRDMDILDEFNITDYVR